MMKITHINAMKSWNEWAFSEPGIPFWHELSEEEKREKIQDVIFLCRFKENRP